MDGVELSVVIATHDASTVIEACLLALAAQSGAVALEVIVADSSNDSTPAIVRERFPWVRLLHFEESLTVPALRGRGIAAARGDLIALIEDDCVVEAGWCQAASALAGQDAATGGAVEPGPYRRALDWAVYFCEYGRFMLPVPFEPAAPLPGNNVVYSRRALADLSEAERMDFREVFVHDAWRLAGVPTRVTGALVVRNMNSWLLRHVTSVPFQHGRAYAAQRFGAPRSGPPWRFWPSDCLAGPGDSPSRWR